VQTIGRNCELHPLEIANDGPGYATENSPATAEGDATDAAAARLPAAQASTSWAAARSGLGWGADATHEVVGGLRSVVGVARAVVGGVTVGGGTVAADVGGWAVGDGLPPHPVTSHVAATVAVIARPAMAEKGPDTRPILPASPRSGTKRPRTARI
jgi:hypothetical protein